MKIMGVQFKKIPETYNSRSYRIQYKDKIKAKANKSIEHYYRLA